ncbi:MAG: DEAD/DEAH box helicase family protein, partial [Caldimicrobium sp.]
AVLFTEIVLDNLKNRENEFLVELNEFLDNYKNEEDINIIDSFTKDDLKKLAYWMATGSGKTLIMHINYYQFFNYKLFSPENIILITPNEGLSKQHFEELQKSGIPARLYVGSLNGGLRSENEVLVIEITKIVEEKKGGGVTLPVDVFGGKNLLFVDEGHKGQAGNKEEMKWKMRRDMISKEGFTFEYSATFGQILPVPQESKRSITEEKRKVFVEYAKSIIFDYSYKYFYLDSYGKDFSILNLRRQNYPDEQNFREVMFVANLLSFYEQLLVYEENKELAEKYNLEKPLWIFVGTTVTGRQAESDVLLIVGLLNKTLQDENWLISWVEKILKNESGLKDNEDIDVFQNKFLYLRERGINLDDLYKRVFNGKGRLNLYELKNAEGEIGLKTGENEYFGVINIGDVSNFKKLIQEIGLEVKDDVISNSLFDDIKKKNSKINLLIGSKKFIEGWDTWRVSSMGLLNIGSNQGPQIIQLFGRGVRLKGKDMSLKRSGDYPKIKILETLYIYGIKADYLNKFLEAISREEVELETIEIPVKFQHKEKWESLYTLSKPQKKFDEEEVLMLDIDRTIKFSLDLLPKITIAEARERREEGIETQETRTAYKKWSFNEYKQLFELLDFDKIYQEILEFKIQRNYWNLVFNKDSIREILLSDTYKIKSLSDIFELKNKEKINKLEDLAILVIKKYLDIYYRKKAKRFETENLKYEPLKQLSIPFISENQQGYIVQVNKKNKELIEKIKILVSEASKLFEEGNGDLPRIYLDSSLYVPILLQNKKVDKIIPAGLVESEEKFLKDLRNYLEKNREKYSHIEVYILRNIAKSGIGFQLKWAGFYPDFIMWLKKENKQAIVFVEPKALEFTKGLIDEKIQFQKELKIIEQKLGNSNIILESFILSDTSYNELIEGMTDPPSKEDFKKNSVLFFEDANWPEELFNKLKSFLK